MKGIRFWGKLQTRTGNTRFYDEQKEQAGRTTGTMRCCAAACKRRAVYHWDFYYHPDICN